MHRHIDLLFPPPPSKKWVCMPVALYFRVSAEEQREREAIATRPVARRAGAQSVGQHYS